jgi:hypothetical protein
MAYKDDQELLNKIGLSDADLRDMQDKYSKFVASLNPAQAKSLAHSTPTSKQAAATLGPDVTSDVLEDFIRKHSTAAPSTMLFNQGGPSK